MKEKIISRRKNGMFMLLVTLFLYIAAIGYCVISVMDFSVGNQPGWSPSASFGY